MTDQEHESSLELNADGRSVSIDTGFYSITVRGDPEDELDDVKHIAFDVARRAKRDVVELDENFDDGDLQHYS